MLRNIVEIDFTITPTGLVAEMTVSAHAHQDSSMGAMRSSMASNQPITIALPMDGLKPGSVMIMGSASANNMMSFDYMLDFGLEKQSLPPAVALVVPVYVHMWCSHDHHTMYHLKRKFCHWQVVHLQ